MFTEGDSSSFPKSESRIIFRNPFPDPGESYFLPFLTFGLFLGFLVRILPLTSDPPSNLVAFLLPTVARELIRPEGSSFHFRRLLHFCVFRFLFRFPVPILLLSLGLCPPCRPPLVPAAPSDRPAEWAAEQSWSSGKVGLLGISYYAGIFHLPFDHRVWN